MLADELHGNGTAALERNISEFLAVRFPLNRNRDDLIFLLRPGAAHLELPVRSGSDGVDILFRRIIRSISRDPENELVERQHRNWSEIPPVEWSARAQRRREQVG